MSSGITRHRNVRFSSATDSVQPESGCTPSAVASPGEQHCRRTEPVLCSWPGFDRRLVKNSQCSAKASLVSRLTIRSSRVRFAASAGHGKMMARRGRKSARLSSGVRPQNQRSGQKSSSRNFLTTGGPPTLEQPRPVSGIAKTRYASAVGCGFTRAKALSVPGLPGQKSIAFSGLTIRSSRDRCAASAKSRRIVTLPWPRSGPA